MKVKNIQYDQPAHDIHKYILGFKFSIEMDDVNSNFIGGYDKPYKAGRKAGLKQVRLTKILTK